MRARRERGVRAKGRPVEITPRDHELLALVGQCRYLSTEQLTREFFPSPDRCRRRLRALFDAGYVTITLQGSTRPQLVSLTRAGLTLARAHRPELADGLSQAGAIKLPGVAHHLAIMDTRLYLQALSVARGTVFARWSNAGGALARTWGLDAVGLRPDALAELVTTDGPFRLSIEVDCGTESQRVLSSKFTRYAEAFMTEAMDELWIVVSAGVQRQDSIAGLVADARLGSVTRIVAHAHTLARPAMQPPAVVASRARDVRAIGPKQVASHPADPSLSRAVSATRPAVDRSAVPRVVG